MKHILKHHESKRWKIFNSKISPGVMIYDEYLEKISVDISTGNKQIDEIIIKAAYLCLHDNEFSHYVKEYEVKDYEHIR